MLHAEQRSNKYNWNIVESGVKHHKPTTNFIVFDLTQLGLETTIYCTWDEHTNHYTTDAVEWIDMSLA